MSETSSFPTSVASSKLPRYHLDVPVVGLSPLNVPVGQEVIVAGWAFLDGEVRTTPLIALEIVSVRTGATMRFSAERHPRPDVAAHFGGEQLLMSGFTSRIRIGGRLHGEQSVRLLQIEDAQVYRSIELLAFTAPPAPYEANARKEIAARFLQGSGLEVGALQRRLEVPDHCSVVYVDRMPLADLLAHYPELRGQPIQPPDLIDDGETLGTVESNSQDFVIANHFLEHCEDPIRTLVNLTRVLKDGGILYMAVPDKRFTFDIGRPVTPYAVLADTFVQGRRSDREDLYVEWAAFVNHASPSEANAVAQKLLREKYSIHFNVWALPDLLEFLARSRADFRLSFALEWVVCSENEIILILIKQPWAEVV